MKAFESNFTNVIIRFYVMMGVVIIAGFTGLWWLAVLALPIFLTGMMSVRFFDKKSTENGKVVKFDKKDKEQRAAM